LTVKVAAPMTTDSVCPAPVLLFCRTVPLNAIGEVVTTPCVGEFKVMLLALLFAESASQGHPSASVSSKVKGPPRPGKFTDAGETLGVQSVGELKSILTTKPEVPALMEVFGFDV
jgi:hypothetical protein